MSFRLDVVEQADRAKMQVFEKQFGTGCQQSGRVFKEFAVVSYTNHRAMTVSARCEGTLILHKATGSGRNLAWQKTGQHDEIIIVTSAGSQTGQRERLGWT